MDKWNVRPGMFNDQYSIISEKCYAMKRIAFMIFSCNKNVFNSNLIDTLGKNIISNLRKDFKSHTKVHIFLLFLTRVMLMRLSENALIETLRKFWPYLLNELITIFSLKDDDWKIQQNRELAIEAIKLIELLASLNIEDFQMNQWIFMVDGYGMKQNADAEIKLNSGRNEI
jgi:hypothetical protein